MGLFDKFKNALLYPDQYKTHSEAIIISCYFNPQNNPYRLEAFKKFYEKIKHLNHQIIECTIGDTQPELPASPNIKVLQTKNVLWHKESLLNNIVRNLDPKFQYVFWLDADVLFTNQNWLVEGVEQLQTNKIIQPFEYCVHLEEGEDKPDFDLREFERACNEYMQSKRHPNMWRSFCANVATNELWKSEAYDQHGHVGFAWGAQREVLERVPLYDRALVGGADHIIAHAATGQIPCSCITKSFTQDIEAVNDWSRDFYAVAKGKVGYVKGDLYHIWHGDLAKRDYLKRITEFTPIAKTIYEKDEHGLHVTKDDSYVKNYLNTREPVKAEPSYGPLRVKKNTNTSMRVNSGGINNGNNNGDDGFLASMALGYITNSTLVGTLGGGNMLGALVGAELRDAGQNNQPNNNTVADTNYVSNTDDVSQNFS